MTGKRTKMTRSQRISFAVTLLVASVVAWLTLLMIAYFLDEAPYCMQEFSSCLKSLRGVADEIMQYLLT